MSAASRATQIAAEIDACDDFAATLNRLAPALNELLPYDRATLVYFEPDKNEMAVRWIAENSVGSWLPPAEVQMRSSAGTPAEWVRAEGRALVENDTFASPFPHHPVREGGRRSFVLAPLGSPNPVGVIGWTMVEPNRYRPADADTVRPVAEAIGRRIAAGRG